MEAQFWTISQWCVCSCPASIALISLLGFLVWFVCFFSILCSFKLKVVKNMCRFTITYCLSTVKQLSDEGINWQRTRNWNFFLTTRKCNMNCCRIWFNVEINVIHEPNHISKCTTVQYLLHTAGKPNVFVLWALKIKRNEHTLTFIINLVWFLVILASY